jgi:hypothetical protein
VVVADSRSFPAAASRHSSAYAVLAAEQAAAEVDWV